ncbi:MAG TPA: zf-HC2 domain-containing protein [Tepidisphaeraceae bacterium]|nr:zf-HC2 domain-containing protein [Tepidisphaeraceae bacterium]
MTCRDVIGFLDRYCDGELAPLERMRFTLHLSLCSNCRRYLASYRTTIRLSKNAFADSSQPAGDEVPPELARAIMASVQKDRK